MVIKYPTIIRTLFTLLRDAGHMASPKAAHWHPLLGMCDTAVSPQLTNSLQLLTIQIRLLHSQLFKKFFFQVWKYFIIFMRSVFFDKFV